jgi:hypothetical protein
MGEKNLVKAEPSTSAKFKARFKGGKEIVVSEEMKDRLEKLFDRSFDEDKDFEVKTKDGSVLRISQLLEIVPIVHDTTGRDNMQKINEMLKDSIKGGSPISQTWRKRINDNLRGGKSWVYYDTLGNVITRQQADELFGRPDATEVLVTGEKMEQVADIYYSENGRRRVAV